MRLSKAQTSARVHALPQLRFEAQQRMTAFSGLVLLQALFQCLGLKERLRRALEPAGKTGTYGLSSVTLLLVVHLLLGFRCLRDRDLYAHDPLVLRTLGLKRLPNVSTLSRRLSGATASQVESAQSLSQTLVLERLARERLARVTLDFDGTVLSTRRHAEGTAVGFNPRRKGERSYYPLLATVAQTGQFLNVLHRPGNVHDSNGALAFVTATVAAVREYLPTARLEVRLDSAFFSEALLAGLVALKLEFTVSVPMERFPPLKQLLEQQQDWIAVDEQWSYAATDWKPKSWSHTFTFLLLRCKRPVQRKGPLQLDLFVPNDYIYEYKVVVTNKTTSGATALYFHHGRGSQEALIGEAKDACALGYIPQRRRLANQFFCTASLLAHNLGRELQMSAEPRARTSEPQRPALWHFQTLRRLRERLFVRPGRLTQPQGGLTLTASLDPSSQHDLNRLMAPLLDAA